MPNIKISDLSNVTSSGYTPNDLLVIVNYNGNPTGVTRNTKISDITNYVLSGLTFTGGTDFVNVTYNELYSKIINDELEPTRWYRLTDYRSVNFLNGWDKANSNPPSYVSGYTPQEIYTGETEVLLLQSITTNSISPIGYSENYPQDIIDYEPYTNKIGILLLTQNGYMMPDSSIVSGFDLQWDSINNEVYFDMPVGYPLFFGSYLYIYCEFNGGSYYQDGTYNPVTPGVSKCQFPDTNNNPYYFYPKKSSDLKLKNDGQRIVLIDLNYDDYTSYTTNSLFVESLYEKGNAYGWITRRQDTQRGIDVPFDFRGRKYRRFKIEILGNIKSFNYTSTITGISTTTYFNVTGVSSLSGVTNASFDVTVVGGLVTSVIIFNRGKNYKNGGTITIPGTSVGGSITQNITITINEVFSNIDFACIGDKFYNQISDGEYLDFPSLPEKAVSNLVWATPGGSSNLVYRGLNDNSVFIGDTINVKINSDFYNNTILGDFNNNYFNLICDNNIISSLTYTSIYGKFSNNIIQQIFYTNILSPSFGSNTFIGGGGYNLFVNDFYDNTISDDFSNNVFEGKFQNNSIGNGAGSNFQKNKITTDIGNKNFTSSNHVYGDYNCEIFKGSNSVNYLQYFNGTSMQYVSPTA